MPSMWAKLVKELGEDGARAEMARRRSHLKQSIGLAGLDKQKRKEISALGVAKRRENRDNRQATDPQ